jgi:hypothetical protein
MRLLLLLSLPFMVASSAIRSDHPIIGTWTHKLRNGCSEFYTFHPDGTTRVKSNEEISASQYQITDKPNGDEFYVFTDTVTQNNGKKDCMGSSMKIGDKANVYVRFNLAFDKMFMCYEPALDQCFGPLRRLGPGDST